MMWRSSRTIAHGPSRSYRTTKRAMDVVGGAALMLLTFPIVAVFAAAIKLEDGGALIHRRRVLGVAGQEFDAFKLRTMREDADAWLAARGDLSATYSANVKLLNDPRVTRTGRVARRFSVDELPQLMNVVRGQMSLVGPRMIHPSELPRYGTFGAERMTVKPGLTGLWQVSGRQSLKYDLRVQLDREYVRQQSLSTDLRILIKTIPAVFGGRGAH